MEYISAEEFLKQPVEVQRVFIEWWKPTEGDLVNKVVYIHNIKCNKVGCIDYEWWQEIKEDDDIDINNVEDIKQFVSDWISDIPLLTEGQLRKFIEYKKQCKIDIQNCEDATYLYLYDLNDLEGMHLEEYAIGTTDLLQAYWKVACEIAKEG